MSKRRHLVVAAISDVHLPAYADKEIIAHYLQIMCLLSFMTYIELLERSSLQNNEITCFVYP
jgi:hypothetical protein